MKGISFDLIISLIAGIFVCLVVFPMVAGLALARTLVTEPEIRLMDEPMSRLYPLTKERIGRQLKNIQQEMGITTIYVTHNQEEAVSLGNRVSILHRGKIEQAEAPDELFSHPKTEFVAHFVGQTTF